jgi:hypothetical protein
MDRCLPALSLSWACFAMIGIGEAVAASAAADGSILSQVILDNAGVNGGLNPGGASPASQYDADFPFDAAAADDFVLPTRPLCRWSITEIYWSGAYWGDQNFTALEGFRIVLWPDVDGAPPIGLAPLPDIQDALAVYEIVGAAGETPNEAGTPGAHDYHALLPVPFEAESDARYWLQIQARMAYPPQWGMHITHSRNGAGPVQYFDLLGLPAWTDVPDHGDLAFTLLGHPVSIACDDGNACTDDVCAHGQCAGTPIVCDDGNACTTDSCDPVVGCRAASVACDDGNACTADTCDPAVGCQTTPMVCADGDACTTDTCDPAGGCAFAELDCGDDDACTTDVCVEGVCEHHPANDADADGDTDVADFVLLGSCMNAATSTVAAECACQDLNHDGRVDLQDFAVFQLMFTGSK